MLHVTQPFLPPREEFERMLDEIWECNWLTNDGPFVKQLEQELQDYLQIPAISLVNNGTSALQFAIRVLDLHGEIITTPFSHIATTTSIVWQNCTPVFADIDENTLNIDPKTIEDRITPSTSAILATHVYGNPCDIDAIQIIAKKHNLRVIYDAAHCFGVTYKGKSILEFGDVSAISFHATKLFHTIEGGAVVSANPAIAKSIKYLRNFGHDGPANFNGVGINGKNCEVHAAMGICNLRYMNKILQKSRENCTRYDELLLSEKSIRRPAIRNPEEYNFAYYPIIVESEEALLQIVDALERHDIFPRRYFYPALCSLEYCNEQLCPVAEDIAKRVLCLPLYYTLQRTEIETVCTIITQALRMGTLVKNTTASVVPSS